MTSLKPVLVDFEGKTEGHALVDWHTFILEANRVCLDGGAERLFGGPEIIPADEDPTGVYTEEYPDALVELDGDGTSTARVRSRTDHGSSVIRVAAERLGLTVVELDDESSASRQHYVDTGRYLRPGS